MRHVIACIDLRTRLNCLRDGFFCMSKMDTNLWRWMVYKCTRIMDSKTNILMESFPTFLLKLYIEILMDGCSKTSSNIFLEHQWIPLNEWKKKNIYKCLGNLVDFQIAFKKCRKTIGTEARRNFRYSSKQNLSWEKNLNKQLVRSLQGLRNEH